MVKYVSDTKAGKSISAYIILNKKGEHVATVKAHFSDGGTCLVNVHDDKAGFQRGTASGFGYDKFTSALSGLTIDGHELTGHCSRDGAPKPPKGRKTFPHDVKPRKGYSFANYTTISRETGNTIYRDEWIKRAYEELGIADASNDEKNARWNEVAEKAHDLETTWRKSEDCEAGYSSCFRLSGLDYLKALSYRVIQAI
ncbi:hypothetical protein EM858_14400 [Agrobacterium sp. CNPSo 2736]|uniref:hypothetical protein n=1 Tax=Agrobacterium sp. CNPSo 2736 TaxID=2499627 RepID=UPI000FD8B763|nr:hypothetical protein [Agrobacterium sp. CNPSo 2736]RVT75635.1 hypothetical protein EM858_14400 [Agrobacterium sp. CNPSo 2736]